MFSSSNLYSRQFFNVFICYQALIFHCNELSRLKYKTSKKLCLKRFIYLYVVCNRIYRLYLVWQVQMLQITFYTWLATLCSLLSHLKMYRKRLCWKHSGLFQQKKGNCSRSLNSHNNRGDLLFAQDSPTTLQGQKSCKTLKYSKM